MSIELWMAYVGTVLVLMSIPGPSHLLMLSQSLTFGPRLAAWTAAGDLSANALQATAAGIGLAGLMMASGEALTIVKWAGVLFLVYLGLRRLLVREELPAGSRTGSASASRLFLTGFLTSAANPKAVLFFAALFPQFLNPEQPLLLQILLLGATYLLLDALFLAGYALGSARISGHLAEIPPNLLNRVAGGSLITVAILLGLKDVEAHSG